MNYVKRKSAKQEARTAKEFGGKVTPASGALDGAKGDVKTSLYLIENKYTDANFYKLDASIWEKIFREATKDGLRIPLMQIDIQDCELVLGYRDDILDSLEDREMDSFAVCTPNKSIKILKSWFDDTDLLHIAIKGHKLSVVKKELFLDGQMQT